MNTPANMKLEHITSLHSHVYLCDRLHLTVQNNSHEARPGSSLASALLLQLPLSPVTLTHFSKMQPPVEPTSLPANHIRAGRTGRRQKKKAEWKTWREKKRSKPGLVGIFCTFSSSNPQRNINYYGWGIKRKRRGRLTDVQPTDYS